jgi:hypothetical protein
LDQPAKDRAAVAHWQQELRLTPIRVLDSLAS